MGNGNDKVLMHSVIPAGETGKVDRPDSPVAHSAASRTEVLCQDLLIAVRILDWS